MRTRPSGAFRLARAGAWPVLLTPPVAENQKPDQPVEVRLAAEGRDRSCAAPAGLFNIATHGKEQVMHLPPFQVWEADGRGREIEDQFDVFLRQLEALGQKRCFGSNGAEEAVRMVEESVAAPPPDVLYFRNRHRGDGMFDLTPGVRIKIQRVHFRDESKGVSLANYLGTTTVAYECLAAGGNRIRFRRERPVLDPANLAVQVDKLQEYALPDRTHRMLYYRLFYLNLFVPKKIQRAALVVGAPSITRLDQITAELKEHPETPCTDRLFAGAECVAFDGRVTASIEFQVFVKGTARYVTAGTRIGGVIGAKTEERMAALRSLRIERLYLGKPAPVRFTADDAAALEIQVVPGDRVGW